MKANYLKIISIVLLGEKNNLVKKNEEIADNTITQHIYNMFGLL